jgi:mitochondrial fission protein ELM1
MSTQPERTRRGFILVLATCLLASLIAVVYPIYVIRPFRAQGAQELALALVVSRLRPTVTVISAAAALALLPWYWRAQPQRWRRALAIADAALVCVLAVLARVNVYEIMFHPIDKASFGAAPEVKLDKNEKVIAVKIGASARAYPIRSMSYHHIINDVIGKTAIVATY